MSEDYCVYLHKNIISGDIFYVGKGRLKRPYSKHARSNKWQEYVLNNGGDFDVEIFISGLSNHQATCIESELINNLDYALVNECTSNIHKTGLLEVANAFYYDETSPTFLRWKHPLKMSKMKVGDIAGNVSKKGYANIFYKDKHYKAHRVIWVMFNNKEIPESMVINHVDCNPSNNNISNLECVSIKENNRKSKNILYNDLRVDNSSGVNGVSRLKVRVNDPTSTLYQYVAHYRIDDKPHTRSFAITKYGEELAKEMAVSWREAMTIPEVADRDKAVELFNNKYGSLLERDLITGVIYTEDCGRKLFISSITKDKITKRKKFSTRKYGYDEAYRLACEWRKQMEELYYK